MFITRKPWPGPGQAKPGQGQGPWPWLGNSQATGPAKPGQSHGFQAKPSQHITTLNTSPTTVNNTSTCKLVGTNIQRIINAPHPRPAHLVESRWCGLDSEGVTVGLNMGCRKSGPFSHPSTKFFYLFEWAIKWHI